MARIDKFYNKEEMIPKAIKEAERTFQTTSGNYKLEQDVIRRVAFLKDSVQYIKEKEKADVELAAINKAKKEAGVELPAIKSEMKKVQEEIDELKKHQTFKFETKESFDK